MSYVLAKSKDSAIHEAGECGGAVTSIFKYLLDEGIVDGVLALRPSDDIYDGVLLAKFIRDAFSDAVGATGDNYDFILKHMDSSYGLWIQCTMYEKTKPPIFAYLFNKVCFLRWKTV